MKKVFIPIVALLAFSILVTSVSANLEQYAVRFYGSASGYCHVIIPFVGGFSGRGRVHVRGLAIALHLPDADSIYESEEMWTRRTSMRVSWNSAKLMVYMWASGDTYGTFSGTSDEFYIYDLSFSGYRMADSAAPHYFRGLARVKFFYTGVCYYLAEVTLYLGPGPPILTVEWFSYEARCFNHRVTAWPIDLPIIF